MAQHEDPDYDRLSELKAFDDTKAGVKGLVDAGVTQLPCIFKAPPHLLDISQPNFSPDDPEFIFPIIDLEGVAQNPDKRKQIVEKVKDASSNWGFFQVVNHGIPMSVLEEMKAGVRRFHEQDVEVKKEFYTRDVVGKKIIYNSNFDLYTGAFANWRDTVLFHIASDTPSPDEYPACCREIVLEYSKKVGKVRELVLELLSEALGLASNRIKEMEGAEGLNLVCHYYPACPQPQLTMGACKHADSTLITILLQDHLGGLQLISNDKFVSAEHRVLSQNVGPRISIASFFSNGFTGNPIKYGPIEELLSENDPPKYRHTTRAEFNAHFFRKGLDGISALHHFKL
ncbi:1-aminocyclopropane-1-carboxylate oxidase homolog 1 [Linum perenne]